LIDVRLKPDEHDNGFYPDTMGGVPTRKSVLTGDRLGEKGNPPFSFP